MSLQVSKITWNQGHILIREFIAVARGSLDKAHEQDRAHSYRTGPDEKGLFGIYGGRFVAETSWPLILDLEKAYEDAKADPVSTPSSTNSLSIMSAGRAALFCREADGAWAAAKIYSSAKNSTIPAPQDQHVMGQILSPGAWQDAHQSPETGAGQHGVATATAAPLRLNACLYGRGRYRAAEAQCLPHELLGAEVVPALSGSRTLKVRSTKRCATGRHVEDTFYCIGTCRPHPLSGKLVRDFQCVSHETKKQMLQRERRLPDSLYRPIGGGSNAMGLFPPLPRRQGHRDYGVEARAAVFRAKHAASITGGRPGPAWQRNLYPDG